MLQVIFSETIRDRNKLFKNILKPNEGFDIYDIRNSVVEFYKKNIEGTTSIFSPRTAHKSSKLEVAISSRDIVY